MRERSDADTARRGVTQCAPNLRTRKQQPNEQVAVGARVKAEGARFEAREQHIPQGEHVMTALIEGSQVAEDERDERLLVGYPKQLGQLGSRRAPSTLMAAVNGAREHER